MADWGGLVERIGFPSVIALLLVIYLTRNITGELKAVREDLRTERTERTRYQDKMTIELTTQTVLLSQLLAGSGLKLPNRLDVHLDGHTSTEGEGNKA